MNACPTQREATSLLATASAAFVTLALLTGCGDKNDKPATQTAAKVNKEEITVHQINAVLAQQRGTKPEQADEAARRALERLIDQELAVQKAAVLKVDRDPRVVQAIESARREIVARAYIDKLGEGAPMPAPAEIKDYYDKHPELFKERRVYQLQEVAVESAADQQAALNAKVKSVKNVGEFVEYLKSGGFKFAANQAVRGAEQIPLSSLPELARLKDGQSLFSKTPTGVNVVFLVASRVQAVDEERARKPIEAYLLNERKRKLVDDDLKALRAAAKIDYVGKYAGAVPMTESIKGPTAAEVAASAAATLDPKSVNEGLGLKTGEKEANAVQAADAAVKPTSGVDTATINKGLGLK